MSVTGTWAPFDISKINMHSEELFCIYSVRGVWDVCGTLLQDLRGSVYLSKPHTSLAVPPR